MSLTQRDRRARLESMRADPLAPGMFVVTNYSSESEYVVDVRGPACECPDFEYRHAEIGRCKHIRFAERVESGDVCAHCGGETHRVSCPER